jgi:alternate signal-mediated exported protein
MEYPPFRGCSNWGARRGHPGLIQENIMNKLTKGMIAGAAGVVLLLGGGGTFALWNDSADIPGGTISSGELSIDATTAGVWHDVSFDTLPAVVIIDPATFLMVPGDTVEYAQDVTLNATGNNLLANFGYTSTPSAVPAGFTVTVEVLDDGGLPVTGPITVVDGATYSVVLTVDLPIAADNTTQLQDVVLDDIQLTVTQVRP